MTLDRLGRARTVYFKFWYCDHKVQVVQWQWQMSPRTPFVQSFLLIIWDSCTRLDYYLSPGRCSVDIRVWITWRLIRLSCKRVTRISFSIILSLSTAPVVLNLRPQVFLYLWFGAVSKRKYSGISSIMIHFLNDHWQCQDPDWVAFLKINTLIAASPITIYCGSTWIYIYWGSESFRWRFGLFWFALVH